MFVKVICKKSRVHESLYECDRVHIRPTEPYVCGDRDAFGCAKGAILKRFIIDLEKDGAASRSVSVEILQIPQMELYIMNSEGKTIESYIWA
ncbi:MAG: hypothetical protein KJ847_05105 [Firmicutes bacterium]|nr:hypothetical protein [Bacillota bacterium]